MSDDQNDMDSLDLDDAQFQTMLSKLPHIRDHEEMWREDELIPISAEEAARGLREAIALAREKGWIPEETTGCRCLICRAFDDWLNGAL